MDDIILLPIFVNLRRRIMISDAQTFYLIVNRKAVVGTSVMLADVYRTQKDDDGFLYMVYASQEIFG